MAACRIRRSEEEDGVHWFAWEAFLDVARQSKSSATTVLVGGVLLAQANRPIRGAIAMRGNIRSRPLANTTEDGINGTQRNFRASVPQSRRADASRETQQNNKLYRPEPRKLATGLRKLLPGISGSRFNGVKLVALN